MPLIDKQGLDALSVYKNCGADNSITLKYILKPFHDWLIQFVPTWVAPNVITLFGFLCVLIALLTTSQFSPSLNSTVPNWVFLVNGLCIFAYQTLDNLDGKQARRTGSSSPLGELFDHGVDALTTTLAGIVWIATIRTGTTITSVLVLGTAIVTFVMATWEELYRGGLFLGYINGAIEGLLGYITFQFAAAYFGSDIFLRTFNETFGISGFVGQLPLGGLGVFIVVFFAIPSITLNIINVNQVIREKKLSYLRVYFSLFPVFSIVLCMVLWAKFSTMSIFTTHPYLFFLVHGIASAYFISNMTLAYLCKQAFNPFHPMVIVPIYLGCANALIGYVKGSAPVCEHHVLIILAFMIFSSYVGFVFRVGSEITSHLKIRVFSLRHLKQK